ncbi:unnamed protein product [Ilex paraguariensis]|uniref:Uncharacterized protein n=1 Tax=Ilex paraguariensis TaxID=185542 RepID=A0ABC8RI23_9AQUA
MAQTPPTTTNAAVGGGSPKRLSFILLESVTTVWAVCTKQATRARKKLTATNSKISTRSTLTMPKQLLATISNKAINFRHKKRFNEECDPNEGFGEGGLWQRNILMGDKCQPLDFSGVIYYDSEGKRLNDLPMRSPRASPLPSYMYSSAKREYN